jgi:hypothetical protein
VYTLNKIDVNTWTSIYCIQLTQKLFERTKNQKKMDLTQSKLSKAEWTNIEISVSEQESKILHLIRDGYHDVNLKRNNTLSLLGCMKIEASPEIHAHLFIKYFDSEIRAMSTIKGIPSDFLEISKTVLKTGSGSTSKKSVLKSKDQIRIQNMDSKIGEHRSELFEFILLGLCKTVFVNKTDVAFSLYTLMQLKKTSIAHVNPHLMVFVDRIIQKAAESMSIPSVLQEAYYFIEKNPNLLKYEDRTLFDHQKQLFTMFKHSPRTPKLVLYIAPTGTGKTLSPIGLSEGHRIIFICAARHVGLALAKSAISVGKRVAFAFGCDTASDIRLHYFAATEYTRNKKTGGIGKVDNSIGDKVEIMICDVHSYLVAMHYMLAFSPLMNQYEEGEDQDEDEAQVYKDKDLITYWDEPTITMDYLDHPLHATIQRNWQENRISKMVLSCATLPKEAEILDTIMDFRAKFAGAEIHSICSYDCKKSIALLNKSGKSVVPHFLFSEYVDLQTCVQHCKENKTLLRYLDLQEIVRCIQVIHNKPNALEERYRLVSYFADDGIQGITMHSLKLYYLVVLEHVAETCWPSIYAELAESQKTKFSAKLTGVQITTEDAHTLTDGPTIFLAEDVEKVGRFYVQQTAIPHRVYEAVSEKIAQNSVIQKRLDSLTRSLEDKAAGELDKEKKVERETLSPEVKRLMGEIEQMRAQIRVVSLDQVYLPNTTPHQRHWIKDDRIVANAFISSVDDESIRDVMALDVPDQTKLLLLLGIGVFDNQKAANPQYMEIVKRLAYQQQLFVILASSDYIYGTNYQFCHGFVGKDLAQMTQQKTIQAMGRIGRNQMQQEYTVRFRDDAVLSQLFQAPAENREAVIMSRLFCG